MITVCISDHQGSRVRVSIVFLFPGKGCRQVAGVPCLQCKHKVLHLETKPIATAFGELV